GRAMVTPAGPARAPGAPGASLGARFFLSRRGWRLAAMIRRRDLRHLEVPLRGRGARRSGALGQPARPHRADRRAPRNAASVPRAALHHAAPGRDPQQPARRRRRLHPRAPPAEITVLEVVQALDGRLGDEAAEAGGIWAEGVEALRAVFRATTIADIARRQAE